MWPGAIISSVQRILKVATTDINAYVVGLGRRRVCVILINKPERGALHKKHKPICTVRFNQNVKMVAGKFDEHAAKRKTSRIKRVSS